VGWGVTGWNVFRKGQETRGFEEFLGLNAQNMLLIKK
jgi:hypothetical protein